MYNSSLCFATALCKQWTPPCPKIEAGLDNSLEWVLPVQHTWIYSFAPDTFARTDHLVIQSQQVSSKQNHLTGLDFLMAWVEFCNVKTGHSYHARVWSRPSDARLGTAWLVGLVQSSLFHTACMRGPRSTCERRSCAIWIISSCMNWTRCGMYTILCLGKHATNRYTSMWLLTPKAAREQNHWTVLSLI